MRADRPLRILQVVPETTGGIGAHVRMLTAELSRLGHAVTIVAPEATVDRLAVVATGARVVSLPVGSLQQLIGVRRALRDLARGHDITHAHGARAGAQAALSSVHPFVVTWHNAPLGTLVRRGLHHGLERLTARFADVVLGASADLVDRARRAGARDARLCELPAPALSGARRRVGQQLSKPPKVLAVARLHRQKRLDLLIAAAAAWAGRPDAPEVLIVGEGPLAAGLQEQARRTGAPIRFLGARRDIGALLDEADVAVLASDWEARPFVAQEALRAGVPLVATDVGGVRELVGDAAVLVPAGDAQALRRGVESVLADEAIRARLQQAGPARAATWPTPVEMASEVEAIYLEVMSRSSSLRR